MLRKNVKKLYNNFHQQHAQTSLKYRNNHGKSVQTRGGGGDRSIGWLLYSLVIKLLCVSSLKAETLAVVTPPISLISAETSLIDATASKVLTTTKTFADKKPRTIESSLYSAFSDLEKGIVERLIKEWAPVVWLAPEEKFMPLGVEEFLVHVHPESKDKSFTSETPFKDNSEKSFLVTNTEIEKLLENKTSFIYGRNPYISPVPIYAVVTLCKQDRITDLKQNILPSFQATNSPQLLETAMQHGFLLKANPTRGPYIPVSLVPQNEAYNNLKRSSRLYPIFHKTKRSLPNSPNSPPASSYDLVLGESIQHSPLNQKMTSDTIKADYDKESEKIKVNNFIANLVDNVKFSLPLNEKENDLENEDGERQTSEFTYTEGTKIPSFHVTYWMFYPYSQGKNMCTLSLGPFGRIPFPAVYGYCLGRKKDIGSHIGDWEHMTLYFTGSVEPEAMYVSAHDAGAYYGYNRLTGSFEFKRQETRKGILQRPNFPKTVTTFNDHPVLFAAKGSHGLWTAPGKHRFVKVARLYDINGFGTPWNTWKDVRITYENLKSYGRAFAPSWLSFKGKWGNPKSKCHPFRRIGLNFCEFTDGPTGIPLKEAHFKCDITLTS